MIAVMHAAIPAVKQQMFPPPDSAVPSDRASSFGGSVKGDVLPETQAALLNLQALQPVRMAHSGGIAVTRARKPSDGC